MYLHIPSNMNRQRALQAAIAAEQAYIGFSPFDWAEIYEIEDEKTCTQLSILKSIEGDLTIAFRGSESRTDWTINLNYNPTEDPFKCLIPRELIDDQGQILLKSDKQKVRVHKGFYRAYLSVRDKIYHYISTHSRTKITLTGHSLGGAIAILCGYDLAKHLKSEIDCLEVYSFGAPKVGNGAFYKEYSELVTNSQHYVNGADIVPRLPRWWQGYSAQPSLIQLGQRWKLNFLSSRFRDHLIEEYVLELENEYSIS